LIDVLENVESVAADSSMPLCCLDEKLVVENCQVELVVFPSALDTSNLPFDFLTAVEKLGIEVEIIVGVIEGELVTVALGEILLKVV